MSVASWCFCVVLCVSFCTGHFVMVPLNLTYLHCLQHSLFEHLFNLYCTRHRSWTKSNITECLSYVWQTYSDVTKIEWRYTCNYNINYIIFYCWPMFPYTTILLNWEKGKSNTGVVEKIMCTQTSNITIRWDLFPLSRRVAYKIGFSKQFKASVARNRDGVLINCVCCNTKTSSGCWSHVGTCNGLAKCVFVIPCLVSQTFQHISHKEPSIAINYRQVFI